METQTTATAKPSKEYNGHIDKGHWNVALWIGNEEHTYRFAMAAIRDAKQNPSRIHWLTRATRHFLAIYEGSRTPDGFKYTFGRVKEALRDLDD